MDKPTFRERLDMTNNEREVRERIARGLYHTQHLAVAKEWVREREDARNREAEARRESREEQALAVAQENMELARASADAASTSAHAARSQATWAKWAAIIAVVAAIAAAKDMLYSLWQALRL
ncbi:hypothetical protein [Polaromonas aquatica]|uniref:hypothetical protein n=1 Tax=Polaromonas aquatica TaxID=332657 RepID=UPI003D64F666